MDLLKSFSSLSFIFIFSFILNDNYQNTYCRLNLVATVKEREPQDGEASHTTNTSITIRFLKNNQKPVFNCSQIQFAFTEELLEQSLDLSCTASYQVEDDTLPIFYYIDPESTNEIIDNTFAVNASSGAISLKQKISYKEDKKFEFRIVASNDSSPISYDPNSFLNVICNVNI